MKFSERWLKEWVPTDDVERLCEQLTNAGLEVEGTAPVSPALSGVVVATVTSVAPHPAKPAAPGVHTLSICEVDAGQAGAATVVCGAPNVRVGGKYPLATVGATLPDGAKAPDQRKSIARTQVHGVASAGMLCSEAELGLGADDAGLLELPCSLPLGQDLRDALNLDDVAIELDLTPNRGDCLSIRGLAREAGLLNDVPVSPPRMVDVPVLGSAEFPVAVSNPAGCPRYLGRVIEDVDPSACSPLWLRERLRRCGLRAIDPVVDVTNYVLLELGQPLHAFDLAQLEDGIDVRNGVAGERIVLLDGQRIDVDENVLLIADGDGPVAIAGVMGGQRSAVSSTTRDVFLESAFFSPTAVAATARRFDLHTDAAHRFERGVDWQLQAQAVERASALLLDIVGGKAGPVMEAVSASHLPSAHTVRLRKARLRHLVGEAIPDADVLRIFERLELSPSVSGSGDDVVWTVVSPSHRFDIEREEDLVEEVLRVYGYNTVPARVPKMALALGEPAARTLPTARLADALVDLGYAEAMAYSFIDPKVADILDPGRNALHIVNPISSAHAAMRTNILPGLVAALRTNLARQAERLRMFEIGQCFRESEGGLEQTVRCGGILFGRRDVEGWANAGAAVDFFDVKGDVERLLAFSGKTAAFSRADDPVLHPGQSATVTLDGQVAGRLGRLHPEVEAALELPAGVFVFELNAEAVCELRPRRHRQLSRHPAVRRDLSVVVPRTVEAGDIEAVARRSLGDLATGFHVFDVYEGEGMDATEKSVALGITMQHPQRTLTEPEIREHIERAVAALASELGARLR